MTFIVSEDQSSALLDCGDGRTLHLIQVPAPDRYMNRCRNCACYMLHPWGGCCLARTYTTAFCWGSRKDGIRGYWAAVPPPDKETP